MRCHPTNDFLDLLEAQPHVALVAGSYTQYNSSSAAAEVNDYSLMFERESEGVWRTYPPPAAEPGRCHSVQGPHNFVMARAETLRRYPWHPKLASMPLRRTSCACT